MAHEQNRPPLLGHVAHLAQALALELSIANRQHFIYHQNLGFEVRRHGESQAQVHTARVTLHRGIDEGADLREVNDLIEFSLDLAAVHPQDRPVQVYILPPG